MALFTLGANGLGTGVGGKVLQVSDLAESSSLGQQFNNNTSWSAVSGLSKSITPSSTSNKIIIKGAIHAELQAAEGYGIRIKRDSTVIYETANYTHYNSTGTSYGFGMKFDRIDSPSSTNSITYSIEVQTNTTNNASLSNGAKSYFYLTEIEG